MRIKFGDYVVKELPIDKFLVGDCLRLCSEPSNCREVLLYIKTAQFTCVNLSTGLTRAVLTGDLWRGCFGAMVITDPEDFGEPDLSEGNNVDTV